MPYPFVIGKNTKKRAPTQIPVDTNEFILAIRHRARFHVISVRVARVTGRLATIGFSVS